jgi:hypothetical protein
MYFWEVKKGLKRAWLSRPKNLVCHPFYYFFFNLLTSLSTDWLIAKNWYYGGV